MTDNTAWGVAGIVGIVLIVAVYFAATPTHSGMQSSGLSETLAGQAYSSGDAWRSPADVQPPQIMPPEQQPPQIMPPVCEENRFCDGTKLIIVNEDCSLHRAYCRHGCRSGQCL